MNSFLWIILFYLFSLSAAPVPALGSLSIDTACCHDACFTAADIDFNQKAGAGDDNCGDGCNPFITCHCCPGFMVPVMETFVRPAIHQKDESMVYRPWRAAKHIHNIWHPPKARLLSC